MFLGKMSSVLKSHLFAFATTDRLTKVGKDIGRGLVIRLE